MLEIRLAAMAALMALLPTAAVNAEALSLDEDETAAAPVKELDGFAARPPSPSSPAPCA